jgi:hypothetical protein
VVMIGSDAGGAQSRDTNRQPAGGR